jgi:thiamine-phosphate pyrophosphorylase
MLSRCSCQTGRVRNRRELLRRARLYLVCDERSDEFVAAALRGGVEIVQLRMKGAEDDLVLGAARRYARICAAAGALLILNDRPDLVPAAGADGVHVGQDDMPVEQARELVGSGRLVGRSTHTPAQVDAAMATGVDYIGVGPVHATPTKPGRPAVGLALVRYAAAHATVPFFAIGGLDAANLLPAVAAGATRAAVVRAITDAGDPEPAARELRSALAAAQAATQAGEEARVGAT